jgi:tetratricopeptide (TPR) repeat protein
VPASFPLADLLALLRERKMEIGTQEHLSVGRLLSRWSDTDVETLRDALAAVLARNQEEVETVRVAFDELYRPAAKKETGQPLHSLKRQPEQRSRRWVVLAIAAAVTFGLILGALLWPRPRPPGPQPIVSLGPSQPLPAGVLRPHRPTIPDTYARPDWERVLAGAAGLAGGLLLGLYRIRLRRAAEHDARRRWHEELAELPEPQGYEIRLGHMAPPFSPAVLEEAASLLGRRALSSPSLKELDIDRTLQSTLHSGLAPQVVFRVRSAAPSLLVLEDIGSEMAPWRSRVSALLAGLAARGVPLDRWQFDIDASRVFRSLGEPAISLRQLVRMRAASPLLIISTGEGILQGWEGRTAPWIEQLALWQQRAWLHPVGDPSSWHPTLRRPEEMAISLWPMTQEGLLSAARHLAHGRPGPARATWRNATDRPVAPLDVDRLRWLLSLAPRRDPDLLERLRQEFCPHVPQAALLEALEALPLAEPLELPPRADAVHVFLAALLAASEPPPDTAAHERWRFDRALQEIRIPGREKGAIDEFTDLARGPLAGQVGDAIEELIARAPRIPKNPLSDTIARELRRAVLVPIHRRASRFSLGGWRRLPPPAWMASTAALLVAVLTAFALPAFSPAFNREVPVRQEQRYTLRLIDDRGTGDFQFGVSGNQQWRDVSKKLIGRDEKSFAGFPGILKMSDSARGSGYYVRDASAAQNGVLGISNYIQVERRETAPPPLTPPPVPEPKPSKPPRSTHGEIAAPLTNPGLPERPSSPTHGRQEELLPAAGGTAPLKDQLEERAASPRGIDTAPPTTLADKSISDPLVEAEPLMRRALAIDEKNYGLDHPNVARDLSSLAQLLLRTGRLEEAEVLMRQALTIDEKNFGKDHPNLARDLIILAQSLQGMNRVVEAEPLVRRAIDIDEKAFGPNHPNVARDLSNLAQLLQATGRRIEPENLIRRALEIDERSYGPDHPIVATDLTDLSFTLEDLDHPPNEIEPLMRKALAIFYSSYRRNGRENPNQAKALKHYRSLLQAMGKSQAEIDESIVELSRSPN